MTIEKSSQPDSPPDGIQESFDLWPRTHDLPPRWDGLQVQWEGWRDIGAIFICPPPKRPERCPFCASDQAPRINFGRIWTDPATAPAAIGKARLHNGRHLVGTLTAFRCPDCNRDRVLDSIGSSGKWWDLDETDYTDDGSSEI